MEGFEVIIEHDFFSRKPILITFKCRLINLATGVVLHSKDFKHRNFNRGLLEAVKYREAYSNPTVQLGLLAADISQGMGFKVDMAKGFNQFMMDMFQNAHTEFLKEYLGRTKNEVDIEIITTELKKRGEFS